MSFKHHFPRIKVPILSAPMAGVSGAALARAVSAAGGLGFIGGGYSIEKLRKDVMACVGDPFQIGIGILTFTIKDPSEILTLLREVEQSGIIHSVWLFGGSEEAWIAPLKSEFPRIKVIVQVHTVENAQKMVKFGADILVAQGIDAGGHGGAECSSILSLVPEIRKACSDTPVLAAGGIVHGETLYAAMSLGAIGAVLGTRFMLSQESELPEAGKQLAITVQDGGRTTVQTRVYDEMRGTTDWPHTFTGRAIRNKTVEESLDGRDKDELMRDYKSAASSGDYSRIVCWAGTAVGMIDEILPASQIVKNLVAEYNQAVARAPREMSL